MRALASFIILFMLGSSAMAQTDAEIEAAWKLCETKRVPVSRDSTAMFAEGWEKCVDIRRAYTKTAAGVAEAARRQHDKAARDAIDALATKLKGK